jgi:hypothetical protein
LLQARERPIRAAGPVREKRKQAAVRWEALILGPEKPASGERNSEAPGAPGRSAWYAGLDLDYAVGAAVDPARALLRA